MKLRKLAAALLIAGMGTFARAEDRPNYKVLAGDRGHIAIINAKGEVEWEVPCNNTPHDIVQLPNGNILAHMSDTKIEEITPEKKVVWTHISKPTDPKRGIQIHAFQRLENGNTMVSESGNARIIEVDKDDKIVRTIPLTIEKPNAHRDTRMVRPTPSGGYLVCHEGDGKIRVSNDSSCQ